MDGKKLAWILIAGILTIGWWVLRTALRPIEMVLSARSTTNAYGSAGFGDTDWNCNYWGQ